MTAIQCQAVTFDVGGTLIEPWPSVGHVYAEVAAQNGMTGLSFEVVNRQFTLAWRAQRDFDYSRPAWAEVVDATFRGLTKIPPSQTFFPEVYSRFAEPEAWRIFEDVAPSLKSLAARGVKMGVVSNWDERLVPLLRALKLEFEAVVVSCEAGCVKPSPIIFKQAAQKLGVSPQHVLHVGDDFARDVIGARTAGMQALWLRRGQELQEPDQINSLKELCSRIRI
jgi:putative hydrolase of the HAD superfamily